MKYLLLIFIFVFSSSLVTMAQDDGCMQFFPTDEGTVMVSKSYDGSNNLISTMTYKINKAYNYQSDTEVEIGFTLADSKDKVIDQGTLKARCDNGIFYMNMINRALSPDVMKLLGSDTELVGDFLDYPNTFADEPYSSTFGMGGGTFTIQSKKDKKERMTVRVFDRSYLKNEQITTPAGTFSAAKVTFNFETTKDKKTTSYKGTEWYAPNAGIVRTETYDKSGKLQSYTVLTTLKK